ncbi:isoprenyl transferase [Ornithinibacillus halophilus]|uniref:Isoprenyl transferase n=1 Tax=Ornithinibacillus halophilus TaxID=930117 RepID=A0A1M5DVG4_9BACI|nr:isoprenyl transferase [Ornithinibacillus halophilus]SHF70831.1 Undecaprenyl pyrophosphate synthetase [Ornithinibacillus halophilus]
MNANVPKHVAVIMDGNGRWGKSRGLTRSEGHYAGVKAMEKVIDASIEVGIKVLTLYAFSSENWSRPQDEVKYLMHLPVKFFKQKLPEFMKRNCQIRISGNMESLPGSTKKALEKAIEKTKRNDGLIVNFAFNYGGRDDILQAVNNIIQDVQNNKLDIEHLNEEMVANYLYTRDLPDPDIVIRTGGEKRISNFLLWQAATAELAFNDVYFPDFNEEMFKEAINYVHTHDVYGYREMSI